MIDIGKSLNEFTNSLMGAGNTAVNIGNDMLEKQAQLDMFNMQSSLEERTNEFMTQLQNDGDYANWGQKTSEFLTELKNETSNPDSTLYCRNNYTAEKFNQVLTTADGQLRRSVQAMARKKQVEHTQLQNENTLNLYQNTLSGQNRIDAANTLINTSKDLGIYTESQAAELKQNVVLQSVMDDTQKLYYDTAKSHPTWGEAKIKEYVENNGTKFSVDGDEEYTLKIDTRKAKDSGVQLAKTQIKQEQYDNNTRVFETNTKLRNSIYEAGSDPTKLQTIISQCESQMNYIKSLPDGYLSANDKRQRLEELETSKTMAKMASGQSSTSSEKAAAFRTLAGNNLKQFITYGQAGENSNEPGLKNAQVAYVAFKDSLRQALTQGVKDEAGNIVQKTNKEDQDLYIAQHAGDIVGNFFDEFYKDTLAKPEYAGIKSSLSSLVSDMTNPKNKGLYSENAAGQLTDLCMDLMTSVDLSTTDPKEIISKLEKAKNLCYLDKTSSLSIKKGILENKEDYIGRVADTLSSNDAVFTDIEGKETWLGNSKEQADKLSNTLRDQIIKDTGLDPSQVTYEYKRTEDDMESTPVFTVNGRKIEVQKGDKKGYKYVDSKTGATVDINSLRSSNPSIESQKKTNSQEYSSLQQQKIELQNKNFSSLSDMTLSVTKAPAAVQALGYSWATGNAKTKEEREAIGVDRQSAVNDVIIEIGKNSTKGKKAFDAIKKNLPDGMTIQDFNKLKQQEKYQYILK